MKIWIQEVIYRAAFEALNEARLDDLKMRYPQIAWELEDAAKQVPFKYLPWVAKQLLKGEKITQIAPVVNQFDRLVSTNKLELKDINAYKELGLLAIVVDTYKDVKSGTEERKLAKKATKPLYNDGRFVAFQPLSKTAACHYGRGTKWCISATESENLYNTYVNMGAKFIFVFDKNPPSPELDKLVFAFGHDGSAIEWFNALNQSKPNVDHLPRELAKLIASQSPNSGFALDLKRRLQGT